MWTAVRTLLVSTETPLWVTLVLVLGGVVGAYILTPIINSQLETAKIQSAYISDNLKTLSAETAEVTADVKTLDRHLDDIGDKRELEKARQQLAGRLSKLKWKAIELSSITDVPSELEIIADYSRSINALANRVEIATSAKDVDPIGVLMKEYVKQTFLVIRLLAKKAKLRVSLLDAPQ